MVISRKGRMSKYQKLGRTDKATNVDEAFLYREVQLDKKKQQAG